MKIIIQQPWGGLGDNLQFSTIPEVAYKQFGEKCVYISNNNKYRYGNNEIQTVVWRNNLFIAGYTDEVPETNNFKVDKEIGFIGSIEKSYGLNPVSKYPKIYFKYDKNKEDYYKNKIFIDITSSKENITAKEISVWEALTNHLKTMNTEDKEIYLLRFPHIETSPKFSKNDIVTIGRYSKVFNENTFAILFKKDVKEYCIYNLFEYCNLIKYCDTYICSNSGPHALAAAIKQDNKNPLIINFCSKRWHDGGLFHFDNVYYVTD